MIDVELYENKDQKNIGKLLLDIKSTGVKVIGSNHHFEGHTIRKRYIQCIENNGRSRGRYLQDCSNA